MTKQEQERAARCAEFAGLTKSKQFIRNGIAVLSTADAYCRMLPDSTFAFVCDVAAYNPAAKTPQGLKQAHDLLVQLESTGFDVSMGKLRRCGDKENPAWARMRRVKNGIIVDKYEGDGKWPYAALADAVAKLQDAKEK